MYFIGTLSKLHKKMLEAHETHRRTRVLHPKLTHIMCFISEWMGRKRQKSPQHDVKVDLATLYKVFLVMFLVMFISM